MNVNSQLQAVVEAPYNESEPLYPWAVADYKPFSFIRLSGKMTDREVGLVFAQLVDYNDILSEGSANDVLHRVIQAPSLVLPGGIQELLKLCIYCPILMMKAIVVVSQRESTVVKVVTVYQELYFMDKRENYVKNTEKDKKNNWVPWV